MPDEETQGPEDTTPEVSPEDAPSLADAVAPDGAPDPEYGADAITVLEGLEAVRKRPGMYIGSTGERGLHHLVSEIVDNSVDEALAGHCDRIDVTLLADGGVRCVDNGRGIPVDVMPGEGRPAVEVVLTVLHAGGKFGGGGYAVSGGLHGVGSSVVNALSTRLDVEVRRQGHVWRQSYANGVPLAPLEKGEETHETGTTITFWANGDIFETTDYSYETLRTSFQQRAFLNKGLTLSLKDERAHPEDDTAEVSTDDKPQREVSYRYDEGLIDYVKHINAQKKNEPLHETVISLEAEDKEKGIAVEIAMQWTTAYSEAVFTYANNINTSEGGTHEAGFRTALTNLVIDYARTAKPAILKENESLDGSDIREGLTAIISVKLSEPQFEGQTKTKLGNTLARTFVQAQVREHLGHWFQANPKEAWTIAKKAQSASIARQAARKAREASRKSLLERNSLPGKLKDCQSNNPAECEVFIVEGDSAGGSATRGRDPRTQAILPIRGKILNVEKARLDRALGNQEVQALITAFGTGIGEDFNLEKLRYHKIIIMADADVDGQHIRTLLLTLLFRYMSPLVENGHVYLAQPPLYRIKWLGGMENHEFAYSDRERDALIEAGLAAGKKLPKEGRTQRYKGLGEMNWDELSETTMDRTHRTLLQVTLEDAAAADAVFSILMGEDVESRRSFIQRNARDVRFLDV
ncbi:DNA topoisomerase (ATP-hydrolyzing) subunit B [Kineococcus rhizosphaerae]|uniref:DNA gyrase subunit B n=1 Tax=Kineococcus rhizosphaerae TaxID=559628 RepID=A0A2T0QYJ1_9ACTN|nr:DNA topoisomerase (ATP-hydrolyzing) subunit B [Kineococcus rhizosphaerae]PRY11428.1 DNA gyrase subunit B [Kineococcus rhizosphaerae]